MEKISIEREMSLFTSHLREVENLLGIDPIHWIRRKDENQHQSVCGNSYSDGLVVTKHIIGAKFWAQIEDVTCIQCLVYSPHVFPNLTAEGFRRIHERIGILTRMYR